MDSILPEQLWRCQTELEILDTVKAEHYPLIYIDGEVRQLLAVWPTLHNETMISFFTGPKGKIEWLDDNSGECKDYREHRLSKYEEEDFALINWIFRCVTEYLTPTLPQIRSTKEYRELKRIIDITNCAITVEDKVIRNVTVYDVIKYKETEIGHWIRKISLNVSCTHIVKKKNDSKEDILANVWIIA